MKNRSDAWWMVCVAACISASCNSEAPAVTGPGAQAVPPVSAGAPASAPAAGTTTSPTTVPAAAAGAAGSIATPTTAVTGAAASGAAQTSTTPGAVTGAVTGAAGAPGTGVATTATAGAPSNTGGAAAPVAANGYPDLRGGCNLNSGYADDHACIPPPPAAEGLQIHVGPKNYEDKAEVAKFIMKPGEESAECWTFHTPNDQDVYYQTYLLSGRAGTHHIISTMYSTALTDGGFGACADPGTGTNGAIIDNLPGASKAYMPRGIVAPENKHVGRKIPAHAASQADMHYYNLTDHDIVREFWMNIYFAKKEDITEEGAQIRGMGGLGWLITPGTDHTYKYECPIQGNGRILALLGHYHAHGKHFTASLRRNGATTVEKVFEMYDFKDPATFEYDTVSKNPVFSAAAAGAASGMLDVKDGDVLMWDCHIINDSDAILTYTNEVQTGEMCNLWGTSLGITPINCLPAESLR